MRRAMLLGACLLVLSGCGGLQASQIVARAQERTASIETFRFSVSGSADGFRLSGSGAVDSAHDRSQAHLDLGPRGTTDVILDGSVAYVRIDRLAALGGLIPTPWVSADLQGLEQLLGGSWGTLAGRDPLERLRRLGAVQEVGREQVRGIATTHYRARTVEGLRVEVWIDDEGLVRRLRATHAQPVGTVTLELYDFGADVAISPPPASEVFDLTDIVEEDG